MRTSVMFLMLAAASSIIVVLANDQPSFDEYLAKKGKILVGAERTKRAQAYSANVQRISQLNSASSKNPHAAKYKVNEFSLLTLDEFRAQKTGLKLEKSPTARRMQRGTPTTRTTTKRTTTTRTTTTRTTTTRTTTTKTTKSTTTRTTTTKSTRSTTTRTTTSTTTKSNSGTSFDWSSSGYMQPIKDQGSCGSCWAFAAVALVETYYARKSGSLVSLSEQQLVDCEPVSYGCNGGYPDDALTYEKNNGAQSEVSYPYAAKDQSCAYNANSVVTKIGGFNGTRSEADMLNFLQNFGPILICLDADDIMSYSGGVVLSANCGSDSINHAVVLVGYGTDGNLDYWKVRNSWDTWWGEDGYFRLERYKNTCGIVKYDAYFITS